MNEKDTISSQDIPSLIRALGTLALAAATAVAIKWFFSHDNKEEKTQCNGEDQQNNLCSTVQEENTTYHGCLILDGDPTRNKNPPEVNDWGEKKISLLLEGCSDYDSYRGSAEISSQSTNSEQEKGQQINSPCGTKANWITSVACKFNEVAISPANSDFFIQTEDCHNDSVPAAKTRGNATNATKDEMFSGCLTHRCDSLPFKRSSSIQDTECNFGTSSNYGECFDDLNTRHSGCQCKLKDQDKPVDGPFVQRNTVSMGVSGDTVMNGPNKKDGVLICHSEINDTTSLGEQKCSIDNLVIDYDDEDNTLTTSIEMSERKKVEATCNPYACKAEMSTVTDACIPNHDSMPLISDNTAQFEVNSAVHNKNSHCTEMLSHVQKASYAYEIVVSRGNVCNDIKQNVKLHSRMDCQGTNQSDGDQKDILTDCKVTEIPYELKHCIQDAVQNPNADDNDRENMVPLLENVLPNKGSKNCQQFLTSMNADTCRYNALESFQGSSYCGTIDPKQDNMMANTHCYPTYTKELPLSEDLRVTTLYNDAEQIKEHINYTKELPLSEKLRDTTLYNDAEQIKEHINYTKELPLSEKWKAITLYNDAEHTALMYPINLEDPAASFNIQRERNEHDFYAEELSVVLKNNGVSKDLSQNPISEKSHENIDISKESFGLYCAKSNTENAVATFENVMNYSTSLGTVNSTGVTGAEFISGVKSIHYVKDNIQFQNWHTCTAEHQEGSNAITNGYPEISHEATDENNGHSTVIEKRGQHCGKEPLSVLSHPCSSLQNIVFSTADSSLQNTYLCKDTNVPLPGMMGIDNTSQKGEHNANESDFFQESVSISGDEQLSDAGETFSPCAKPLPKDKQNEYSMCFDSNLSSKQDQNTCLSFDVTNLRSEDKDDVTYSREKIMATIAENTELILPEYQSKFRHVKKRPLMTKSCDNILSGRSYQAPTLKTKAQSMLCLVTEYYSSKLPSENGPVEEVARGSFIRIPKGLRCIGEAMRFQLTLGNCLELLKLARKNRVEELLKAVYTVISDNYLNVLKNSAVYGQLTGLERERILQLRMSGKLSLCVVETKSIFGLNKHIRCPVETKEGKSQLYALDIETNQWKPVTSIPEEACLKGCSICSMHNYLFIAGGLQETTEGLTCSNKLFCYNPLTDIWTQLSPMKEGRSQLKLIPLDGYLYAIGGECLHTVERYDPRSNKWTFVAPLPKGTFAVAHEAAACGGEIYISGGHLFYRLLKYSPVHDEWDECTFNTSKGRSCDMVAVGSILYRFDMHKDSSVNILRYNTMAKMWSEYTATFPGSKIPFRCAILEGNIYCLNRETTAKFSMDDEKVVFEAAVFSNVPTKGAGSPHPTVLCLRGSISQTSV